MGSTLELKHKLQGTKCKHRKEDPKKYTVENMYEKSKVQVEKALYAFFRSQKDEVKVARV